MNATQGKIYILRNPYLKDALVKIGKTSRVTELRAKEISAATGVPFEFEVLYEEEVNDTRLAETLIHHKLSDYQVNKRREFFLLPLKIAVKTVFEVCMQLNKSQSNEQEARLAIYLNANISDSKNEFQKLHSLLHSSKGGKTEVLLCMQSENDCTVEIHLNLTTHVTRGLLKKIVDLNFVEDVDCVSNDENLYSEDIQF